jgi:hypothetical protein
MKRAWFWIFLLFANTVLGQTLSMNIMAPEKVYSGTDFIVNVNINKGKVDGFGRLLIKIPSGFTPFEKVSENGKFEFDGEQIKIVWLNLPSASGFSVSFGIKAAPNMEGYQVLRGEMSIGTSKGSFRAEARPHIVTVERTENIATGEEVNINYSYIQEQGVTAIRQKPFLNDDNNAVVNILVSKGDVSGFGKIEETIPPGYIAESKVSNSAIFVFNKSNRRVKFLWMNMPAMNQFVVSYILKPEEGFLEDIPFIITGEFMFAEGKTTKTKEIIERNIELEKLLSE